PGRGIEVGVELAGVEDEAAVVARGGAVEGGEGEEVAGEVEGGRRSVGRPADAAVGLPEEAGAAAAGGREDASAEAAVQREPLGEAVAGRRPEREHLDGEAGLAEGAELPQRPRRLAHVAHEGEEDVGAAVGGRRRRRRIGGHGGGRERGQDRGEKRPERGQKQTAAPGGAQVCRRAGEARGARGEGKEWRG